MRGLLFPNALPSMHPASYYWLFRVTHVHHFEWGSAVRLMFQYLDHPTEALWLGQDSGKLLVGVQQFGSMRRK